jgi:plastocyanin
MTRPSRTTLALGTAAAALVAAASLQAAAPAVKTLNASVGPDTGPRSPISLKRNGATVSSIAAGAYTVKVNDKTNAHNFYLYGPGVTVRTGVEFRGRRTFSVTFKKGKTYRFICTVDPLTMKGSFRAT